MLVILRSNRPANSGSLVAASGAAANVIVSSPRLLLLSVRAA
jgi:hypothetical protein